MITVRWFAGAAEAAGTDEEHYPAASLSAVLASASERHGSHLATVLGRCSILVDGRNVAPEDPWLPDGSVVDVLPPFAGG